LGLRVFYQIMAATHWIRTFFYQLDLAR